MIEKDMEKYIEDYLNEAMDNQTKMKFEEQLKHDKALQDKVRVSRELDHWLNNKEVYELRQNLNKTYNNLYNRKIIGLRPRYFWSIAASVIVIVSLSLLYLFYDRANPQRLYAKYSAPYEYASKTRSGEQLIGKIDCLYLKREYQSAIEIYEQNKETFTTENNILAIYMGIAYTETGNFTKSKDMLQPIANSDKNSFKEIAQWYLSLNYLKSGNIPDARKQLTAIVKDKNHYKKEEAKEILDKLY